MDHVGSYGLPARRFHESENGRSDFAFREWAAAEHENDLFKTPMSAMR